ncbi:MAG: hypothetical protein QOE05_250 [Actinomycetota bacterium]|nr:hypothetical protein [Actinomycetota bacterium]
MYGLTIRWSLTHAEAGVSERLRAYVRDESVARFTGMAGLHYKTWQIVDGGFFAGVYVWATEAARTQFLETFRASPSAVTQLVGHDPDVIQEWDVAGIAVGAEGFPG